MGHGWTSVAQATNEDLGLRAAAAAAAVNPERGRSFCGGAAAAAAAEIPNAISFVRDRLRSGSLRLGLGFVRGPT